MWWWALAGCGGAPVGPPGARSDPTPEDADGDGSPADLDCDDTDPYTFPGAPDVCGDHRSTDCGRSSDDGLVTIDGVGTWDDLGAALPAATAGATVRVCGGTWTGGFVGSVPVVLVAEDGPDLTTLDGDGVTPVLSMPGGTRIVGFTIRGGQADGDGGGVVQTGPETLTLEGCVVTDNFADRGGGIAVAVGGTVVLVGTAVTGNRARGGAGVLVPAGGTLRLEDGASIRENVAQRYGGGVYLDGGVLVGGEISDNEVDAVDPAAPVGGGGIAATGVSSVSGAEVRHNRAPIGGGFSVVDGELSLAGVRVSENRADGVFDAAGGGGYTMRAVLHLDAATTIDGNEALDGGGLYLFGSTVDGGTVSGNVVAGDGGGVEMDAGSILIGVTLTDNQAFLGGAVAIGLGGTVRGCVVDGNRATGGYGGGLFSAGAPEAPLVVEDTRVIGNEATFGGGGIAVESGDLSITGGEIADNVADLDGGGLLLFDIDGTSVFTLTDTVVVRNQAGARGGGAAMTGTESTGGTLVSRTTGWGEDGDDNLPGDVSCRPLDADGAPLDVAVGSGGSFRCTSEGCTEE